MSPAMPRKHILPIKPAEYLQQGLSHCGAYSVKGILSAYGKDDKSDPRDYHTHLLGHLTGAMFDLDGWPRVLRSYGLAATIHSVRALPPLERLHKLKATLAEGTPVMMHIGNGYSPHGRYNPVQAFIVGHWITLWGYDDDEKVFYIYDSFVAKEAHDKSIPVGNVKRSYDQVLRDWGLGSPWKRRYHYIVLEPGSEKYSCRECGYRYADHEWAKKCETWCREHQSCNLEIIRHGNPPLDQSPSRPVS